MKRSQKSFAVVTLGAGLLAAGLATRVLADGHESFIDQLREKIAVSVSTIPTTGPEAGDQNPYGVAIVPSNAGCLKRGHILVSNFNNAANTQGTGSTIVQVDPHDQTQTLFYTATQPAGLTTALLALRSGFVVVGSAPLAPGGGTVVNGSIQFIDAFGNLVLTLTDSALVNGPWDAIADENDADEPRLFVSNVLTGTVVRIHVSVHKGSSQPLVIESIVKIGSGFAFRTDPAALVIGPTGLAWDDKTDDLFVADTGNNRIAKIERASHVERDHGAGITIFSGAPLQGPLGLALTPQRTLLMVNGDAVDVDPALPVNLLIEITRSGEFLAKRQLDNGTAGALFGIAITKFEDEPSLVYVDDNNANVNIIKTR